MQHSANQPDTAAAATVLVIELVILLAFYVWFSYCLFRIAKEMDMESPWLAFIPIGNFLLLSAMVEEPLWTTVLFFIPFVNIYWNAKTWYKLSRMMGKPGWLGILMVISIGCLIVPAILAFSGKNPDRMNMMPYPQT